MKSFLEIIEEAKQGEKHAVMTFGRMNPPTTGHLKVVDKVKEVAHKVGGSHQVIVSHSQDTKKNPLSGEQKVKHLKRYSPGTNFKSSSKEHPTFLQHAAELHKQGVTHLHMVAGSDRVKEYKEKLNKYNGTHKGALYNFKKIHVHSAGQRDPDAEGTTGMSGTKMRDAAAEKRLHDVKNKEGKVIKPGFRSGVPHHVSDTHTKELMHDTRKGMGLHESDDHGRFKAIFVTGGPGSGKDVIIREAIPSSKIVELNLIQARDYLADKQKLSEKTTDYRREAIRNRGPLIINGPADDNEKITYIKEELEELGYETMMVFVNTTDEASKERNSLLNRMMVESIRHDKWEKSQQVARQYQEMYSNFISFDNTGNLNDKEFDIHEVYELSKDFLTKIVINESADEWLIKNNKLDINYTINRLFEDKTNDKTTNRFLKVKTTPSLTASMAVPADNRPTDPNGDNIKWDGNKKRGGYTFRTYESTGNSSVSSSNPKVKSFPEPKEKNFNQDKETKKVKKFGDRSGKEAKLGNPSGLGSEWNTRTNGSGLTGGAGLGNQTYSESQDYSNANPASTAFPSGGSVNPLSSDYEPKKKGFKKFRKEAIDSPGEVAMGVGGTLGGATNKEPMETYADKKNNLIIRDKKKIKESHVEELEKGLVKLNNHSYDSIDKLMQTISKKHGITGKKLHDEFKQKHGKIPDTWIKEKKC
jgi:predicted kinase